MSVVYRGMAMPLVVQAPYRVGRLANLSDGHGQVESVMGQNHSPQVLLAHPGTQYSHRLAVELNRQNLLGRFHTGLAFTAGGWVDLCWQRLSVILPRQLANRRIVGMPNARLRSHPLLELASFRQVNRGGDPQITLHKRNEQFQRAISDADLAAAEAVIGFDTSSWILAERCAALGKPLILDQSIAHPDAKRKIYERVRSRFPDWREGMEDRRPEVRQAEEFEHRKASMVIAASSFTRQTLIEHGVPAKKICVNPYGVDATRFTVAKCDRSKPFRFIFLGSISARKGVPLLLEAWKTLKMSTAELWLVGPASPQILSLIPALPGLRYLGPMPHAELPAVIGQCDVMVFPSYFEGFGLVILEAMACGVPVITTTATAGPDIITHGRDGWIIEPNDLGALTSIMRDCLVNKSLTSEIGQAARATAERFTWSAYGDRWAEILGEVLKMKSRRQKS